MRSCACLPRLALPGDSVLYLLLPAHAATFGVGVVLLARQGPVRSAYPGLRSLPGGHVEEPERLAEALARELRERIGVTPAALTYLGRLWGTHPDAANPATYRMLRGAEWDVAEPTMIEDEHTEMV